jgi:hypothetical protein
LYKILDTPVPYLLFSKQKKQPFYWASDFFFHLRFFYDTQDKRRLDTSAINFRNKNYTFFELCPRGTPFVPMIYDAPFGRKAALYVGRRV